MRLQSRMSLAIAASLLAHGVGLELLEVAGDLQSEPTVVEVEYFGAAAAAGASARDAPVDPPRTSPPVPPGASPSLDNIARRRAGSGGDRAGPVEVVFLSAYADLVTLQDSLPNAYARSQISRVRVARHHASPERRRATPNPDDQPFVTTGDGPVRERRPRAEIPPRRGAPQHHRPPATSGSVRRRPAATSTAALVPIPGRAPAPNAPAAPQGAGETTGTRASRAAPVATGRQPVDHAAVATPSPRRMPRPADVRDAEHLAMRLSRSWVDATRRRGFIPVAGRGGDRVGGPAAAGGAQRGPGASSPHLPGPGRSGALDTSDARYLDWYLAQRRRVQRHLRYPRERAIAMDQGTAVFRLRVRRDGTLTGLPRLVRSTGFADLDRAAERALASAGPFDPLPAQLSPHQGSLPLTISLEFANPLVR